MSIVAIVGRPNVGKSTIFNILTGSKSAIVADFSGLTRDRQYGNLKNSNITLIDTGGLNEASDDMSRAIKKQTDLAIAEADMLLFVVDALDGMLPMDKDLAQNIRKQDKKTILLINKADNSKLEESSSEFNSFGFQEVICLSASHNKGFSELRDYLIDSETFDDYLTEESDPSLKISIIGRPNAGKSTLINALIGEDRLVVSSKSGTTRDSIEVPINMGNKKLTLIDTAGMRRKRSIKELTEKFSVSKSVESIKRADVVIILLDASENIVDQDIHLLGLTLAIGKPVVVVANKMDLLKNKDKDELESKINRKLRFANYLSLHYISAKEGKGLKKLINLAEKIYQSSVKDLDTSILNKLLKVALSNQQPSMSGRFRPKLRYVHSGGNNPPRIIIHGNNLKDIQASYTRYLENFFRKELKLESTPLEVVYKEQTNPFRNKPNQLNERQIKKRKRMIKRRKK
ncbi:MAG: ribosome biogenesis GTPase Der [Flavobacteriaceae bacterium]|nr:ribosome biogenesis GTPase Der [Flavobacteriaceae bacterium]|tara:strand:- start:30 stop:1406 length:1377 start_codon:yes stop_codon:yes gene_type:complete